MTLTELISRAASGYPDAQPLLYWDLEEERPRNNPDGGDTLAYFIVLELAETFDPEASEEEQISEAVRVVKRAARDLEGVAEAILRRKGRGDDRKEERIVKIWIAVVEHRHGQNVYAARTKRKLVDQLYEYVAQWWESEIPDEPLPTDVSKRAAVDRYFELVGHESLDALTDVTVAE